MPIPTNLLSQIANPTVANIPGAFAQGQQQAQQAQAGREQINLLQQEAAGAQQKQTAATDEALLQELTFDVLSSFSIGPGANREKILNNAMRKAPQGSTMATVLQDLINTPEGKEKEKKFLTIINTSREKGLLPSKSQQSKPLQKTGAFLVKDPDTGRSKVLTGVFDPNTGTLKTATSDQSFEVISKLGETPAEQTTRRVGETQQKEQVKKAEVRASDLITRGTVAAESTAGLRRGIELLDSVETGGLRAASIRAKQLFGIESADEGELSNSLSKAVLSQLRETFGAAFTENEGKRLERIEGSFTKSTEGNKRLLGQALKIAERTAERAIKAAQKSGDDLAVEDIQGLLEFSLTPTSTQVAPQTPGQTQVLNFDSQGNLIP